MERLRVGTDAPPQQTLGFQRVLQRAAAHVQSAGREELDGRDVLVAIFREAESHAPTSSPSRHHAPRRDQLHLAWYCKVPEAPGPASEEEEDDDEEGARPARDPLGAFTVNLVAQAAAGRIDPLIGRERELERTIHVLCRRRKNNPVFGGRPGGGQDGHRRGLRAPRPPRRGAAALKDVGVYALDMGALLAGTKFPRRVRGAAEAVIDALKAKPGAILFIDEIHTVVGAGATQGGSMDAPTS